MSYPRSLKEVVAEQGLSPMLPTRPFSLSSFPIHRDREESQVTGQSHTWVMFYRTCPVLSKQELGGGPQAGSFMSLHVCQPHTTPVQDPTGPRTARDTPARERDSHCDTAQLLLQ